MEENLPKFSVELKQTAKGEWYAGSVKVVANTRGELEQLLSEAVIVAKNELEIANATAKSDEMNILPSNRAKANSADVSELLLPEEKTIFYDLKRIRTNLATNANVPPYVIFRDSVLAALAKLKPKNREEMLMVKGVGETNFEKYGRQFLEYLQKQSPQNK